MHYKRLQINGYVGEAKPKWESMNSKSIVSIKNRLFKNINKDNAGCWLWTGAIDGGGYGSLRFNRKVEKVHRISAYVFFDFDLSSDKQILHHCDNPLCFNPEHLYIGDTSKNMKDRRNRDRAGANHKLTKEDVYIIKQKICNGDIGRNIAKDFQVTEGTICDIKMGRIWKDICQNCGSHDVDERKMKGFCKKCGQLLYTCCD